jgi:2-polyprenyl-3-methyl-5-hydroxy-6-metoxy-1,4-benzoquinol methylase
MMTPARDPTTSEVQQLMDYGAHDPVRYKPSREQALAQGRRGLRAISAWLPASLEVPVLEVGCGAGNLLAAFQESGYSNTSGVDSEADLVDHARRVIGVEAYEGDWLSYLQQSDGSYGSVIALDVIEHLTREIVEETLRATRLRLRPDGNLILRLPNARCPFVLPMFAGDLTHRLLIAPDLLEHLLRNAGFAGRIEFAETYPDRRWKRAIFTITHGLIVKPLLSALYFHFYQQFPRVLTRNIYCCAYASSTRE